MLELKSHTPTEVVLTPREIVEHLDRHIVGQRDAKRAVAIAVAFVASLAAMVLCTLAESGESIHVQMGALSALTLGAAVLLPWGWVPQAHRPPEVAGRTYYEPSPHGFEEEIARRMAEHTDEDQR